MTILLLGSSIIKRWDNFDIINFDFVNAGSSGLLTKTLRTSNYLKEIIQINEIEDIIFYCGGNDIRKKIETIDILSNIESFIQQLKKIYKSARIIIISIIKSPLAYKENLVQKIKDVNKELKKMAKKLNNVLYLDIGKCLDNPTHFRNDDLHLKLSGYDILNSKLKRLF